MKKQHEAQQEPAGEASPVSAASALGPAMCPKFAAEGATEVAKGTIEAAAVTAAAATATVAQTGAAPARDR